MTKASQARRRRTERTLAAARQQIVDATESIITAIIEGARSGNYLQAKFLFDFAGLSGAAGDPLPPPSLAETLLRLLQAPPESAAKNPGSGGDATTAAR